MQKQTKLWLKLAVCMLAFIIIWHCLYVMFDNYAMYFGWLLAGVLVYLFYHLLSVLVD